MDPVRYQDLQPHETDLLGTWVSTGAGVEGDETCRRIQWLLEARLERVGEANWEAWYIDPHDGRLWALTFPHSEMHGGGPPRLSLVSREDAKTRYGFGAA